MENKEKLIQYCNSLCDSLNANGFKDRMSFRGEIEEFEYNVYDDMPEATISAISGNKQAWEFLKRKSLLRSNICHFCGESLVNSKYTFTEPINNFELPICQSCHGKGIKNQVDLGIKKANTGCLSVMIIASIVFASLLFI